MRKFGVGVLNKKQMIKAYADAVGNDIVFDFGDETLMLKGFSDLDELEDDVLVF